MRTPRLPVVDWTDAPADLNGLVRFAETGNLVCARVPSHFKRSLLQDIWRYRRGVASTDVVITGFACKSIPSPNPVSINVTLLFSFHLLLDFPSGYFPPACIYIFSHACWYMRHPDQINIWREIQITKQFFRSPVTSSVFCAGIKHSFVHSFRVCMCLSSRPNSDTPGNFECRTWRVPNTFRSEGKVTSATRLKDTQTVTQVSDGCIDTHWSPCTMGFRNGGQADDNYAVQRQRICQRLPHFGFEQLGWHSNEV